MTTKPRLAVATPRRLSIADAVAEQRQLTARDIRLLMLLDTHKVLTSLQIARLLFASDNVARKRLAKLTDRSVLARFRVCPGIGSVPWRYTLGPLGAMIVAADHGHTPPTPRTTHERMLALSRSTHLEHLLGINDFFSQLALRARTDPGCGLREWRNERETARMCADIVRPDGYGRWAEHGSEARFFLEFDNGTEPFDRVAAKLHGYRDMATAGLNLPVLFVFTGPRRHTNFRRVLDTASACSAGLMVATTSTTDVEIHGPAGAVWLPVGARTRRTLIDLTPPSPIATEESHVHQRLQ